MTERKYNKIMKKIAGELEREELAALPSDEELKKMYVPEGALEEIARNLGLDTDRLKELEVGRRAKMIAKRRWIAIAAAVILAVGTMGIGAGAGRLGFILEAIQGITGNNEIRAIEKKSMNQEALKTLYGDIYRSKGDLSFDPVVFRYIPPSVQYEGFDIRVGGRELMVYYSGDNTDVRLTQRYTMGHDALGRRLDSTNTEQRRVKINGKEVVLYIVKYAEGSNYGVSWSDAENRYCTIVAQGLPLEELLDMIRSAKPL